MGPGPVKASGLSTKSGMLGSAFVEQLVKQHQHASGWPKGGLMMRPPRTVRFPISQLVITWPDCLWAPP